jgi:hypothetical protein
VRFLPSLSLFVSSLPKGEASEVVMMAYICMCWSNRSRETRCYNNCPKDPRKTGAEGDIQIYCGQASIYGSRATAGASMSSTGAAGGTSATPTGDSASSSTGSAGAKETGNSAAGMKAGSLLLAAAGMMAVV